MVATYIYPAGNEPGPFNPKGKLRMPVTQQDDGSFANISPDSPLSARLESLFDIDLKTGRYGDKYKYYHKFGRCATLGATMKPISIDGIYQTPQAGSGQQLRVKAGNANDNPTGSGARKVILEGIEDSTGNLITEEIETNGASAGTLSTKTFLRLFRVEVTESGTYASQVAPSYAGDIVVEDASGNIWGSARAINGFNIGQSQISAFTVPTGYTAYVRSINITADSKKDAVSVVFFRRAGVLETSVPYEAMKAASVYDGVSQVTSPVVKGVMGPFNQNTDIGFMGSYLGAGDGTAGVDFEILLIKN